MFEDFEVFFVFLSFSPTWIRRTREHKFYCAMEETHVLYSIKLNCCEDDTRYTIIHGIFTFLSLLLNYLLSETTYGLVLKINVADSSHRARASALSWAPAFCTATTLILLCTSIVDHLCGGVINGFSFVISPTTKMHFIKKELHHGQTRQLKIRKIANHFNTYVKKSVFKIVYYKRSQRVLFARSAGCFVGLAPMFPRTHQVQHRRSQVNAYFTFINILYTNATRQRYQEYRTFGVVCCSEFVCFMVWSGFVFFILKIEP